MRGDDRHRPRCGATFCRSSECPRPSAARPVDAVPADLSPEFAQLYSPVGRPSTPPEKLLRALLLQVLYSTRGDDPGNPTVDFHGERRSNLTHVSTTHPDARLSRKASGHEAE